MQYLQCLIPDRNAGYLFPHSLTMGAFGVNEYQINKHRPQIVEGQDWFRLKGEDRIIRVYYSLAGLLKLADLINTPQSQAFKQALIQHCQGGAIVKSHPAPLSPAPTAPTALYAEPFVTEGFEPNFSFQPPLADPAYRLAQYLQPDLSQVEERAIASHAPASHAPLSPEATAAMIFEAQRVVFEAQQVASEHILKAQRFSTPEVHVTVNWERWNTWLDQQGVFAFSILAAGLFALAGVGGWLLVSTATPSPNESPSQQLRP